MKVIVIGAGFTGVQVVRALLEEGHKVSLIDSDPSRVRELAGQLDCAVIPSEGNGLETLERAGIASADALVALSGSDEVNMIACALADGVYPKVLKVARVRNYAYYTDTAAAVRRYGEAFGGDRRPPFGIDWMINPEVEASEAICRAVSHGAVGGVIELVSGYGIVSLPVGADSPLCGTPLWRLPSVEGWRFLVAFVETPAGALLPVGTTAVSAGDRIGVLARLSEVQEVARLCDTEGCSSGRIGIVGAGRIGKILLSRRGRTWRDIAVIDADLEDCREMAGTFRDVRVLCGDATDPVLIREEGLDRFDIMVAASGNHDRNLITAARMKESGVKRTVALVESSSVRDLAAKLGVDVAVPMRDTVVDSVMGRLRGRNVQAVHTVCGGAFEIVECTVAEGAKAAGKTLKEIELAGAGLVLLRTGTDGKALVPRGDSVMSAGSHLVLILPAGDQRALKVFCGK